MKCHDDHNPRVVSDDGAWERTAGRLLVARLRVEIATREAAQPSDRRMGEARRELCALTGVDRDVGLTGRAACRMWSAVLLGRRFRRCPPAGRLGLGTSRELRGRTTREG